MDSGWVSPNFEDACVPLRADRRRGILIIVSEQSDNAGVVSVPATAHGFARLATSSPVENTDELLADVWDDDKEIEDFLADVRMSRNSSVG